MVRLTRLDIPELFKGVLPVAVTQVVFAILCSGAALGLRALINLQWPGTGPFVIPLPFVLIATLFGRWPAGAITLAISSLSAWYFFLPVERSFTIANPADGPRIAVNIIAGLFIVALAELFRSSMRRALADREMLMLELEHRVKNNFSSIASMLRLQMNAADEETQRALQTALGRVESFSRAHRFLYQDFDRAGLVDMRAYIRDLCRTIAPPDDRALEVECDADTVLMPRDRAITIGLLINEVATNSIKHAFQGREKGTIRIRFTDGPKAYQLVVTDDGTGMASEVRPGSLGLKLIDALAEQARGRFECESDASGTAFRFEFAH